MLKKQAPQALINSILAWCPEIVQIKDAYIAGGFVRAYYAGERPKDMDIYFERSDSIETAKNYLKECEWEVVFETDRAITLNKNDRAIQLIRVFVGGPESAVEHFDFTVCMVAVKLNVDTEGKITGHIWMHEDFFEHLAGRVLVYTGSSFPLASLKRAFKYVSRGYHICDENIIALAEDIAYTVNFGDDNSVAEHIAGMDPEGGRRIRVID